MNIHAGQRQTKLHRLVKIFGVALGLAIAAPSFTAAGTFSVESKQQFDAVEADIRAAQFLSRATFGPTKTDIEILSTDIETMGATAAFEKWIDGQLAMDFSNHHEIATNMIDYDAWPTPITEGISTSNYRQFAWWHAALKAPDQLRQRMAWALMQIFVVNDFNGTFNSRAFDKSGKPQYLGVVDYYDMLGRNTVGNYRTLLEDVSRHPIMGIFLSHLKNKKADLIKGTYPDENYGREVQQLMSIGLYDIKNNGDYKVDKFKDPIPSYDNDDIITFSRVFTGLDYAGSAGTNLHDPMTMVADWHDSDEKFLHNGTVLPAGQSADQDLSDALDNLFNHPNTGPFIARLLIQRFVKSNPSSRYIGAVAAAFADNGNGVRGDFEAVIKAVLLNSEAVNAYSFSINRKKLTIALSSGGTEHSRLQEPVIRYAAFLRAFDPTAMVRNTVGEFEIHDYTFVPTYYRDDLNQWPYRSPSIFNFYLPEHVPGGELQDYRPKTRVPNRTIYAPEFQIMTAVALNRLANRFRSNVYNQQIDYSYRRYFAKDGSPYGSYEYDVLLNFQDEIAKADDPADLVQHLDLLLCRGNMSDASRDALVAILEAKTTNPVTRAEGAILATLTAPDCAIHE